MIAIITPYYSKKGDQRFAKRKEYLYQTIKSVSSQDMDLVHLIVDDGSDDGVVENLHDLFDDKRLKTIFRKRRTGDILTCTNAINYGLEKILNCELGNIDYITFLHSDDLVMDLASRIRYMGGKSLDFIYTDAIIFLDGKTQGIVWEGLTGSPNKVKEDLWPKGKMPYPTMTWSFDFVKLISEFNLFNYGSSFFDNNIGCGEDVDIALTTLKLAVIKKKRVGYLKKLTAAYRIHNSSLAEIRNQEERRNEENKVIFKHFGASGYVLQNIKRFIYRPECYFPSLMNLAISKRQKTDLKDIEKWLKN